MFDQLLSRHFHILRHRSGPYSEERQRYLSFLIQEGRSRKTLQDVCGLLYSIAQVLPLDRRVTIPQIEAAADGYGNPDTVLGEACMPRNGGLCITLQSAFVCSGASSSRLPNKPLDWSWKHFSPSRFENAVSLQQRYRIDSARCPRSSLGWQSRSRVWRRSLPIILPAILRLSEQSADGNERRFPFL